MNSPDFPKQFRDRGPTTAYLMAVEKWLRTVLNDKPDSPIGELVGIHTSGRPHPAAGAYYFSIHTPNVSGQSSQAEYVENKYGLAVTLSYRRSFAPKDREGIAVVAGESILFDVMDWIASEQGLHGNYEVMKAANALITMNSQSQGQGFHKPLLFGTMTGEEKGPGWWGASSGAKPEFGFAVTATFQGSEFVRGRVL